MSRESPILKKLIKKAALKNAQLFRNSCGMYEYQGRWIKYGLGRGSSDLVGWTSITISPDMVGKKAAIFTAVEAKTAGYKRVTPEQTAFLESVRDAGGIAVLYQEGDEL